MVTTTFDCTPAQTARLVSGGVAVVVLAAFPGEFERTSYLAAGAHYLLMSTDTPLLEILDLLARGDFGS